MSEVKNFKPSSSTAYFLPNCHDKPKMCLNPNKMAAYETEWKIERKDQDGDKEEVEGVSFNLVDDSKPHQLDARGKRTGTVIKMDVLVNVKPEEKMRYNKKTMMRTFVCPRMPALREMANCALKNSTDGDMRVRRVNRIEPVQEVKIAKSAITKKNGKHIDIDDYSSDAVAQGVIHIQVKMKPNKEVDGVAILDITEVGLVIDKIKHNYERLTPNSTYNFECTDTRSDGMKKEILEELTKYARVRTKKVVSDVLKAADGKEVTAKDVSRARKSQSSKVTGADDEATDNESIEGDDDEVLREASVGIAASSSVPDYFDMAADEDEDEATERDEAVAARINKAMESDESLKKAVKQRADDGRSAASRSQAESAVNEELAKNKKAKEDAQKKLQEMKEASEKRKAQSTSSASKTGDEGKSQASAKTSGPPAKSEEDKGTK